MLSLTLLPVLVLVLPALGALAAGGMGRPLVGNPGIWARWAVRTGLFASLAAAGDLLLRIQPAGTVEITLWQLDSKLPVTLQVGVGGALVAMVVLVAALVVSFAAEDRRPLASAALGLAALGGVLAATSGGLLSLFMGLQLSAVGGIGLSYARFPRAASHRIVWAAVADQAVALIWLGAVVVVYHSAGTVQFSDIPTDSVDFLLALILVVPAAVRLGSVALVGSGGTERESLRGTDVADWLSVVAVPTALVVLLRVQELSGGSWPAAGFGTMLDLLALGLTASAALVVVTSPRRHFELRALLLVGVALILLGFGSNSSTGTELGVGAGVFLELAVAFVPRAVLADLRVTGPQGPGGVVLTMVLRGATMMALLPFSLPVAATLIGLSLGLRTGGLSGLLPAVGFLLCLAVLALMVPGALQSGQRWSARFWPLAVPAALLVAATIVSGWVFTGVAAAIAFSGSLVTSPLTSPDALSLQLSGLLFPDGYLILLAALLGVGWLALSYASGREFGAPAVRSGEVVPDELAPAPLATWRHFQPGVDRDKLWRVLTMGLALAEREMAERPIWLWLTTTAVVAWLMAQR